ncbi:hypothetical protein DSO57_1008105 [Entomophthora muscae]|uniref:Uncharacterized protein n=1 Tax=Entomophthora muscae TaxID=34485 RepID=A0ACC2RY95_9FUNG|nr:hypothetical protein DSO57_1008105 [Entomophthora muscae]
MKTEESEKIDWNPSCDIQLKPKNNTGKDKDKANPTQSILDNSWSPVEVYKTNKLNLHNTAKSKGATISPNQVKDETQIQLQDENVIEVISEKLYDQLEAFFSSDRVLVNNQPIYSETDLLESTWKKLTIEGDDVRIWSDKIVNAPDSKLQNEALDLSLAVLGPEIQPVKVSELTDTLKQCKLAKRLGPGSNNTSIWDVSIARLLVIVFGQPNLRFKATDQEK